MLWAIIESEGWWHWENSKAKMSALSRSNQIVWCKYLLKKSPKWSNKISFPFLKWMDSKLPPGMLKFLMATLKALTFYLILIGTVALLGFVFLQMSDKINDFDKSSWMLIAFVAFALMTTLFQLLQVE